MLGLKPTELFGNYAKGYECPKAWIRKPRKTRQLSKEQKDKLKQRLSQKSILSEVTPCAVGESGGEDG